MTEMHAQPRPRLPRRTVLLAGAGAAGVAVLAGCSSGGDPSGGGSSGGAVTSERAPDGPGTSPTAASPGPVRATELTELSAVAVGGAKSVTLPDGSPAIVARPTAQKAVCFSAICTHMGCTVAPSGDTLNCPCHGSQYDALTGQVLRGPAPDPLPPIPVRVQGGMVVVTS